MNKHLNFNKLYRCLLGSLCILHAASLFAQSLQVSVTDEEGNPLGDSVVEFKGFLVTPTCWYI